MQTMTVGQKDTLTKSAVLKASGRTIAKFNFNRFIDITSVTNPLDTNPDNAYFPVNSVVLNARPEAGIVKAMTSTTGYPVIGRVGGALTASDKDLWSYTTSLDDKYKYWRSPEFSTSVLYLGAAGHYTLPKAQIEVLYAKSAEANQIVVGFENSYIQPEHVTIETRTGSTWTPTTFVNPILNSAGQLVLYRQANNTWATTVYRDTTVSLNGVRVTVNAVSAQNANAYIIEVAACREIEVTNDVFEVTADDTISEHSIVLPIGTISSNEATVTLDNIARKYAEHNTSSDLAPFMGRWGEFTFEFNIHKPSATPVEGDYKRLFRRYVDIFRDEQYRAVFELKDSSMLLQEAKPPAVTLTNVSVAAIAVYLCHSVGFRRVAYDIQDVDPQDTHSQLKYFWADPEKSVWEQLSQLSQATQTAFYFDEDDVLQIKTRSAAMNLAASPVWVYDADDVSLADVTAQSRPAGDAGKLADLKEFTENVQEPPNTIEVKYVPTDAAKVIRGNPTMALAWEPEETIALRSSNIIADIPLNTTTEHAIKISGADATIWPYTGMMQVETEIIQYSGKEYSYYLANGTTALKYVESVEEQAALDALNEGFTWRNVYTGNLRVKVGGRGFRNTVAAQHLRAGKTYTSRVRTGAGALVSGAKYVTKNLTAGTMRMNLTAYKPLASLTRLTAVTAGPLAAAPRLYGTSITFATSGYYSGAAGIIIGAGANDSGLYVEIVRSAVNGVRTRNNELNITWKSSTGVETLYGKGTAVAIGLGIEYQMDVAVVSDATNHYVTAYIDGTARLNIVVPKAASVATLPASSGMFIRSSTIADFGYYYVYGGQFEDTGIDGSTYLDLIKGGYRSAVFRTIASLPGTRTSTHPTSTVITRSGTTGSILVDEFGAIGHEVRDFDVSYSVFPALSSSLYISNNTQVACTDFMPTPTSAKFTMVNISRKTAVVNGEDTLSFGPDNSVNQKLTVYGRMVTREEAKSKKSTNDKSVVRSGTNEITIESDWIQTEAQATRIGEWVMAASDASDGELKAFANPYIQLLDMIGVQDSHHDRAWATDKHFVVGRSVTFSKGLSVDLTTRRAV